MADSLRIITPEAILSYPHLFQPQAAEEGKPEKYSCALVFTADADLTEMRKAAVKVAKEKWPEVKKGSNGNLVVPGKHAVKMPFRTDAEAKGYPEGSTFMNVRSNKRPGIVDQQVQPITDEEKMYPGAVVRASVRPFAYDTQGNRGVSFALNNIQLLRDGERLDSRVAPEEDFDAVEPVDLSDLEEAEDAAEDNGDSDPIDELLA